MVVYPTTSDSTAADKGAFLCGEIGEIVFTQLHATEAAQEVQEIQEIQERPCGRGRRPGHGTKAKERMGGALRVVEVALYREAGAKKTGF